MLKRLLNEPLFHFAVLALLFFAANGLMNREGGEAPDNLTITRPRIQHLASLFVKTWQREPTPEELKGLIDDFVKEEIYYREGKKLGLDIDDTMIRRRIRQKMEFLNNAATEVRPPSNAELEAYLKDHSADFAIEPSLAFEQIYLKPERHGDRIERDAESILQILHNNPKADPAMYGDGSSLPGFLSVKSKTEISQIFGPEFADAVIKAGQDKWIGPVRSRFGLHLVRITKSVAGRAPTLAEVRDAVTREWANARRKQREDQRFEELLKRYTLTIETTDTAAP